MKSSNVTSIARKTLLRRGRDLLKSARRGAKHRDVMESLSDQEKLELAKIHAALEKIERGIFGKCECCGTAMTEERMLSLPWNEYCAACDLPSNLDAVEPALSATSSLS